MKVTVQGISFDNLTLEEAVREALSSPEPCRVVTPNALILRACRERADYAELINSASLVLPDGQGVVLAARRQGTPLKERVAGIDFAERLLQRAAARGDRVFLLGGRDGVAPRAAERLRARYPNLRICGCYWGYFQPFGEENLRVLGMIAATVPSILLVCMGFPLQEQWIRENLFRLPSVRVAVGLGGSLDVWSGQKKRAPRPLQAMGMEWAWRMLREPARMKDLPELIRFLGD